MIREEREKAISILKISAPVMAVTQEEFNDYVQTLNKIMDWLEQEPCDDCVSRYEALSHARKEGTKFEQPYEVIDADVIRALPPVTPQPREDAEPAQVELTGDGYADGELVYDFGRCPNCGWEFENGDKDWEEPYCCHCGQKLRWFETKEVE